jgi:hypothetical protein
MATTRKADRKGRVTLFSDFADSLVIIERISDEEVRIRKTKATPRKFTLSQLLAGVTPENLHAEVKTGSAVCHRGSEQDRAVAQSGRVTAPCTGNDPR